MLVDDNRSLPDSIYNVSNPLANEAEILGGIP